MKRVPKLRLLSVAGACVLVGCTPHASTPAAPSTHTVVVSTTPAKPPAAVTPVRAKNCPYLRSADVADTNGQHVSTTRISADKPYPACFFYRPDGHLQLTVRVYVGSPDIAHALIDQAAPVATSAKADQPAGWTGGSQPTDSGAVYAVTKGGTAVVVTTNQKQTIKARVITENTITALHL